jgi:hypothetical protein
MGLLQVVKNRILEIYRKYLARDKIKKFPIFYINRESNITAAIRSTRRGKGLKGFRKK